MKSLSIIAVIALISTACTTTYYSSSYADGIYASPRSSNSQPYAGEDKSSYDEQTYAQEEYEYEAEQRNADGDYTTETYVDENGNTIINNNYYGDVYDYDDYYDYAYSARIRSRFRESYLRS